MRSKPFIFKNQNSKFYKLRYYDNGSPKTITTGQTQPKPAQDWADNFLRDPEQSSALNSPVKLLTFLNSNFLPSKSFNNHSIKVYKSIAKLFTEIIPEKFVSQYTTADINKFIDAKRNTISEHTLKSYLTHLNVLFNYAESEKFTRSNPIKKSKPVKPRAVKIKYFTPDDFKALMAAMDNKLIQDITYFAVYTGMRAGEIFSLRREDVLLKQKLILNYQNKVDDYNVISIADDIFEIVERNYNLNNEFLFSYPVKKTKINVIWASRRFKAYVKLAALPDYYCFKSLRKTFGSILWQSNIYLDKVSHLLGHADTRITRKHYAQLGKGYDDTVNKIKLK